MKQKFSVVQKLLGKHGDRLTRDWQWFTS